MYTGALSAQKRKATTAQYVHGLPIEAVKGCNLEALVMPDMLAYFTL